MPAASVSPIDPRLGQFSQWKGAVADVAESSGLLAVLEQVPDPRDARGRRYRLSSLLAVALCAVATGARSFYAIADWVGGVSPEVLKRLGIRFRVPSESAIRLAIGRVDGGVLDRVLGAHLAATATPPGQRLQVALDGKTVRGARNGDTVAPHLVAAITHDGATVLGQRRIDSKSNEIPAVRRLLATIDVAGAVVTVDAMHTQKATARYLRERCKADYVMTVKANQPRLLARVKSQPWAQVPVVWEEPVQRGHGREEQRSYKIVTVARGLAFPYAKQVAQITRRRRRLGTQTWSAEVVYVICSVPAEAAPARLLTAWIRGHWSIENKLHWVRDVTFDEDRSQVRVGNAPQVMATLRNTIISLHRRAGHTNIARACRRHAADPIRALNLILNT